MNMRCQSSLPQSIPALGMPPEGLVKPKFQLECQETLGATKEEMFYSSEVAYFASLGGS